MSYKEYTPHVLRVILSDGSVIDLAGAVEKSGKAFIVYYEADRKLLEGKAFHAFTELIVPGSGSAYLAFTTGNSPVFANIQSITAGNDILDIEFREEASITGGTQVNLINKDRTSSGTSTINIVKNPTVNDEGVIIDKTKVGETALGNIQTVSSISGYTPWRLKANTTYLVKLINSEASDINALIRLEVLEE
ncbi:hypothetical protein J7M07_04315 [bacterium]|nr:hypothetical protein [bacterium]